MHALSALPFDTRRAILAVVMVLIPFPPMVLLAGAGLAQAGGVLIFGSMAALLATAMVRPRFGLLVAASTGVANLLAVVAAPYVVPAALVMAAMTFVYGLSARYGLTGAVLMVPIGVAFTLAQPPQVLAHGSVLANAAVVGLVGVAGGLWGVLAGVLLRSYGRHVKRVKAAKAAASTTAAPTTAAPTTAAPAPTRSRGLLHRPLPPIPASLPWSIALHFGLILGITCGIAMGVVVAMDLQHGGAWLLLTLILVAQPVMSTAFWKSLSRVLGTALGFVIAFVVSLVAPKGTVPLIIALLCLAIAVYIKLDSAKPYWLFVTFLTPGIVLAEGASGNVLETDEKRLWFTLIGVGIALVVIVIARVLGLRDQEMTKPAKT